MSPAKGGHKLPLHWGVGILSGARGTSGFVTDVPLGRLLAAAPEMRRRTINLPLERAIECSF
jgi:hypothetical protein